MDLREDEAERISLIRYQLLVAEQQAEQPGPLSSLALNTVQDATEAALNFIAERSQVLVPNRADFLQLFDKVVAALPPDSSLAGHRGALAAMNQARVNFKHYGNRPERVTVIRHYRNAANFTHALIAVGTGVELAKVSLVLFVRDETVRDHLDVAQKSSDHNDLPAAMGSLRLAFDRLISDYEQRKVWHPGKSLFSTKPSFLPSVFEVRRDGKSAEKAFEWLNSLDGWVKMLALGVDMRRFAYFDAHTPRFAYTLDGRTHLNQREGVNLTQGSFDRCFQFVLDTALSFSVDDFDFDAWAARRAALPHRDQGENIEE